MPGIFVALFWIWTAASVLTLLYRFFTTGTVRPGGTKREALEPIAADEPVDRVAAFEAKLAVEAAEIADATPPDEAVTEDPGATPPAPVEPAATPTPVTPDPGADRIPRAESLAEALTGIQMPADLAPLVGDNLDPRRMLFTTGTASPETVGGALADELERLGFALQPLDERSVAASRPGAAVEVRILPSAEAARTALGDRMEAVPENAVVTEFQLR